jgi:hypothetical protein
MTYRLEGYTNRNAETGYDAESSADTIKEAKQRAKYMMSEEERVANEASSRIVKVQIWKGAELVDELYGREG